MWCDICKREKNETCIGCIYCGQCIPAPSEKSKEIMTCIKVEEFAKLKELATFIFPEIKEMVYVSDDDTKEEYVYITAISKVNHQEPKIGFEFKFKICVTADSPAALVSDVWKELKRRLG